MLLNLVKPLDDSLHDFPDESLFTIFAYFLTYWFANIMNYVVASVFPSLESRAQTDKITSDDKYYVWVTHICGSCAAIRLSRYAFHIMRLTKSYSFVILHTQCSS